MNSFGFGLLAIAHLALTAWIVRSWIVSRSPFAAPAAVVGAALVYENAVLAFGRLLGEGDLLLNLNRGRFVAHLLLTPTLLIPAFGALRRAGLRGMGGGALLACVLAVAGALVLFPSLHELPHLNLAPREEAGVLRYRNLGPGSPPWGAIVATFGALVCGIALAVARRWPWLAVGSVVMFGAAGASSPLAGNAGETVLMAAFAATEAWLLRFAPSSARPRDDPDA